MTMVKTTINKEIAIFEERIEWLKELAATPSNGLGMDDTVDISTNGEHLRITWDNKNDNNKPWTASHR